MVSVPLSVSPRARVVPPKVARGLRPSQPIANYQLGIKHASWPTSSHTPRPYRREPKEGMTQAGVSGYETETSAASTRATYVPERADNSGHSVALTGSAEPV